MTRTRLASRLLDPAFQRLCRRSAFVIYALILLVGSIPGARHEIGEYAAGEVLHSLAYAGLTVLLFLGDGGGPAKRAANAVLLVAAMGAGDELVQSLLPYRNASVLDWTVDVVASVAAAWAMRFLFPRLTGLVSPTVAQ